MIIRSLAWIVPVLFVAWIGTMACVMRFSDAAPGAIVFAPGKNFMDRLPLGVTVIDVRKFSVTLRNDQKGLAKKLYQSGAWLVLPAGLTGCLPFEAP